MADLATVAGLTIGSWTYQLDEIDPNVIAASGFDLAVVDYARNGRDATAPLTDLVESMTRLAQDQACLLDQREMERQASVLLRVGLAYPPAMA